LGAIKPMGLKRRAKID